MKIGLLLGSFDPIHIGHINVAMAAINNGDCDKVLFVVAKHNPFKDYDPAPFDLRCTMVEASIKGLEGKCEVCPIEKNIEGTSYSYKVLGLLKEMYKDDELYILCGMDTFLQTPKWKNYETHIKPFFGFIVIDRDNKLESYLDENEEEFDSLNAIAIKTFTIEMSSSTIRYLIKYKKNPLPFINKETYDIILENNLYDSDK